MVGNSAYSSLQRWGVMAMAVVSSVSTVASATIINVAIPDIMGALGINPVDAQWLSAGFLAAMTASMVLVDYSSKAFGQRQVMVVALAAFVVASAVGAITSDATTLIAMRLIHIPDRSPVERAAHFHEQAGNTELQAGSGPDKLNGCLAGTQQRAAENNRQSPAVECFGRPTGL